MLENQQVLQMWEKKKIVRKEVRTEISQTPVK